MSLRINSWVIVIHDLLGEQVGLSQLFCIVVPFSHGSLFTVFITIILPLPFVCLVSFTKDRKTIQSVKAGDPRRF